MRKRILSAVLVGALSAAVIAGSAISASAKVNPDETYDPDGKDARTYYLAMPGAWENDYWKANENRAGIYWWSGADKPGDNFAHDWPGYVAGRVTQDPVEGSTTELKNLFKSFVPTDTNQIIFNSHINGGMPSQPDFDQAKFDAAKQIVDTNSTYNYIGYDDYQNKDLWMYAFDKFSEQMEYPQIKWDTTTKEITKAEKAMIRGIFYPKNKLKDAEIELYKQNLGDLPEMSVYEAIDAGELDPDNFFIEEFGKYGLNFYIETENQAGLVQNFDNMVYVCNLDPNSMTISTTIVKEGMPTYSGDFFFYYGNGEYGIYPTKEMAIEKLGIEFNEDGSIKKGADGYLVDDYGTLCKMGPGNGDKEAKLMVYGNFTGKYYTNKEPIEIPTDPNATTVPAPATNPTSATSATSGSGNSSNNSANGSVATGDFSFAAVLFVVIAAGLGTFYFTRKKYNK